MSNAAPPPARWGFKRILNAMGAPTILGANTSSEEVRQAVDHALQISVEIDELQAAACRVIARATGAEAGCVTSSCASGLAIASAAAMTGLDLAAISKLPDTSGLRDEIVLPLAHDINFGAPISQMIRLTGAKVRTIGTASHLDAYHVRGAISDQTAALFYVSSGDVNPAGSLLALDAYVELAHEHNRPVIVDTAAGADVRPFLAAGADLVITSAHKQMGAPTSGMLCGNLDFVHACYLQNYGVGRAMKVGKEGILGCMAAVEAWYSRDVAIERVRWRELAAVLAENLTVREGPEPYRVACAIPAKTGLPATALANALREGDPSVWVADADDQRGELVLDLRIMSHEDAGAIAERIADALENPTPPEENVAYHDLYWSEKRLLEWPNWR